MTIWKRTSTKEQIKNVDIAKRRKPIVTTWNKSEQVMSQWQGSWSATVVEKIGEIERYDKIRYSSKMIKCDKFITYLL